LAALVEQLTRVREVRLALRRLALRIVVAAAVCLGSFAVVFAAALPAAAALYLRLEVPLTGALARLLAIAPWLSLGTAVLAGLLALVGAATLASSPLGGRLLSLTPGLAPALRRLALA